jgi:transcriptional antiterminator RfaH
MEMEVTSSPSAEPCPVRKEPAWFCIRTHLKHEHIAAAHLQKLPEVEVFNPQLRLLRSTRRGRRWSTESLFPNYLFARFVLESMLEKVKYTPSVKVVLRFGDRVPEIPDAVIEDLRQGLAEMGSQVLTDAPVEGEEVEVATGAFVGTRALVARVLPGKQRVRILLDVMGRAVPADLSLDFVLFNKRNGTQLALHRAESVSTDKPQHRNLDSPSGELSMDNPNMALLGDVKAHAGTCR